MNRELSTIYPWDATPEELAAIERLKEQNWEDFQERFPGLKRVNRHACAVGVRGCNGTDCWTGGSFGVSDHVALYDFDGGRVFVSHPYPDRVQRDQQCAVDFCERHNLHLEITEAGSWYSHRTWLVVVTEPSLDAPLPDSSRRALIVTEEGA